ncbi:MAG: di-heme oxidoredictase family protein, partial [Pseudomonadota bacterium]
MSRRAYIFVMSLVVISFCPQGLAEPQTLPKPGASWERIRQPGGTLIAPAQHLNSEEKLKFYSGLSFFKQPWIRAPASTTARDGLGPIFNANSCISCHVNGGRSRSLIHDPNTSTAVVRISVVGPDGQVLPHPLFGSQVQTKSTFGLPEAQISVVTHTTSKQVAGREYVLRKPSVSLSFNTGGETKPVAVLSSLRQAPSLIGMGLLEAIEQERLQGLEDPKDSDADGISGRIHWVNDPVLGRAPGRFGWKSLHSTVAAQSGSA